MASFMNKESAKLLAQAKYFNAQRDQSARNDYKKGNPYIVKRAKVKFGWSNLSEISG